MSCGVTWCYWVSSCSGRSVGFNERSPHSITALFCSDLSELLFPLFGLMVSCSAVTMDQHFEVTEIVSQRPGGEGILFRQKLRGLATYFFLMCFYYSFLLHWLKLTSRKRFLDAQSVISSCGVFL